MNTCYFCGNPSTFFTCVDCGRSAAIAARRLLEGINEAAKSNSTHEREIMKKIIELNALDD